MTFAFSARALLLDMDGTLVDSTAVVERLWWEWAQPHGLDHDTVLRTVHGRQGWQSMAMLLPDRDPAINRAENAEMLRAETAQTDGVVEIPGAGALLAALAGHPHGVVTSADLALMTARMEAAGLTVPALAITAEHVSASKPDPEGFLLAADRLGMAAVDCLVLEDSGAGIAAARAAGMPVLGVGAASAAHHPDHVVDDLRGVRITATADGLTVTCG